MRTIFLLLAAQLGHPPLADGFDEYSESLSESNQEEAVKLLTAACEKGYASGCFGRTSPIAPPLKAPPECDGISLLACTTEAHRLTAPRRTHLFEYACAAGLESSCIELVAGYGEIGESEVVHAQVRRQFERDCANDRYMGCFLLTIVDEVEQGPSVKTEVKRLTACGADFDSCNGWMRRYPLRAYPILFVVVMLLVSPPVMLWRRFRRKGTDC